VGFRILAPLPGLEPGTCALRPGGDFFY
jgi:hypothetical protein